MSLKGFSLLLKVNLVSITKEFVFFYTKYSKTKHEFKLTPQKRFKANVPGYIVTKLDIIKNVVLKIHANANDVL